jgi:hypothetical protein
MYAKAPASAKYTVPQRLQGLHSSGQGDLILDNYATHKALKVREWLAWHSRIYPNFGVKNQCPGGLFPQTNQAFLQTGRVFCSIISRPPSTTYSKSPTKPQSQSSELLILNESSIPSGVGTKS